MPEEEEGILDEGLKAQGFALEGSNALVLPAGKKVKRRKVEETPAAKPLSKRAKRAIEKLAAKQKEIKQQAESRAILAKVDFNEEHQRVIQLLSELTTKQNQSTSKFIKICKALISRNVALPTAAQVRYNNYVKRKEQRDQDEDEDLTAAVESEDGDEEKEDEEETVPQLVAEVPSAEKTPADGLTATIVEAASEPFRFERRRHSVEETAPLPTTDADVISGPRAWTDYLAKEVVCRDSGIEAVRSKLPAYAMEQELVEACMNRLCVVVTGGTGCGKSTQVPQFLYEAGFSCRVGEKHLQIGITQPRRIAAIAVADRVREELGDHGEVVSHHVRFDQSPSIQNSRIKFMTDGILMRIFQGDFLLRDFSVIVLDEVHERSTNCDILLGLLTRVVQLRKQLFEQGKIDLPPLRLVLMSATVRLCDFLDNKRLFTKPPFRIHFPSKTHPVTVHFAKQTPEDYVEQAKSTILRIHNRLPAGSILVFLTSQQDITKLQKLLQPKSHRVETPGAMDLADEEDLDETEKHAVDTTHQLEVTNTDQLGELDQPNESIQKSKEENKSAKMIAPSFNIGDEEKETTTDLMPEEVDRADAMKGEQTVSWSGVACGEGKLRVVPLYASLPPEKQAEAFALPANNERIVIIATNVAETSLTLPNIRYVVDSGYSKQRIYSSTGGSSRFEVKLIAKANADQRAGRAGRIGEGHCYRLYSSAVFQHEFEDYPPVQLLNTPLDGVLLSLSSMGVPNLLTFPFPNAPKEIAVLAAAQRLVKLGIIEKSKSDAVTEFNINSLGKLCNKLPLSPRYAVMIIRALFAARSSKSYAILMYTIIAVISLSVGNELFEESYCRDPALMEKIKDLDDVDDIVYTLASLCTVDDTNCKKVCLEKGIVWKRFNEALLNGAQVLKICCNEIFNEQDLNEISTILNFQTSKSLKTAGLTQCQHLIEKYWASIMGTKHEETKRYAKFCVAAGLLDHIAIRLLSIAPLDAAKSQQLPPGEIKRYKKSYKCSELKLPQSATIHPHSAMASKRPLPSVLTYNELIVSGMSSRPYLRGVLSIRAELDELKRLLVPGCVERDLIDEFESRA